MNHGLQGGGENRLVEGYPIELSISMTPVKALENKLFEIL
jgi:hypothetical protein